MPTLEPNHPFLPGKHVSAIRHVFFFWGGERTPNNNHA